jgi:exosortase/archaeosortase family protein
MGYPTSIAYAQNSLAGNMPYLTAINPHVVGTPSTTFAIAWPCAGIESFLIFTVVALLFLKRMNFSWKAKIGYFVFGATITYLINALRIVNIFLIGMAQGANSLEVDLFHFYYGPLYAVTWIVAYPLIIMLSQNLWHKIKKHKQPKTTEAQPV